MPIEHRVDPKEGILRVRRWGDISTHDEDRACRERKADPAMVPGMPVLVDSTGVEPPDATETVKYVADCVVANAAKLKCGPVAIVVSSDVEYGMARMYIAYTDLAHPDADVFRTEVEALNWLSSRAVRGAAKSPAETLTAL